ncbi:MAG: PIN domain-containing protein [Dermatophilaceae bacterium]
MVVLDSTLLIDVLRGRPAVARLRGLRERGTRLATTAVNIGEIVRGIQPGEKDHVAALARGLEAIPVDHEVGWRAGEWRRELAGRAITLWPADCLIAAAAAECGAALATGNPKDFPMDGLDLQHWPVGA